jgi:hypothetical protein
MILRRLFASLLILAALAAPAAATVTSAANKIIVSGNGSQTVFSFPYIGVTAADIVVTYTDALGNATVLTQGTGPTQFQIALNAVVPPSLWGVGGTVTYNPSGTPIASGTTLTIVRTLPYTQTTSLQNQASFGQYASAAEQALDTLAMQVQQLSEQIGRAIVANITNATAPASLPPAAQAIGMGVCFDAVTGANLIACSLAPSGVISSAMAPVVGAASLAAGRSAFGLGTMAQEAINAGTCGGATIQDDGAGNARVVFGTVADSTNQSVTCAFHGTQRIASGPVTYTLPRANTLFNGFGFTIVALAGVETVTPNANDNFPGVASGTSIAIPAGSTCYLTTNAAASGVWYPTCNGANNGLSASVASNALTIVLNSPVLQFRDTTLANGDAVWQAPAGALSVTVPSGASLGTSSSNVPFRVWIFAAYNGGTPVLGVATCSSTTAIYPCKAWELIRKSSTLISAGATSLGTLYTATSGVTNDAVIIIGYADYATGLATAGTWASAPTTLQLCIRPLTCPRPGDIIQDITATSTTAATTTSATFAALSSGLTQAITPTSAPNLIRATSIGNVSQTAAATAFLQITRGSTQIGIPFEPLASTASPLGITLIALDAPGVTTSQTYQVYGKVGSGTLSYPPASTGVYLELQEIMGALPEPANDDGSAALRMVG